ncbi:glycoside hydrolase family 10 protein [Pseudonocardia nigra]|uniref:glycoside hydrolase family 10 protein n=1 Tax=Pseudonocardia nigra TaxID=1921578 RepID=UPI0027E25BEC|nr:family 10 glycosylhydrolase [Pseudonocardia nigra]
MFLQRLRRGAASLLVVATAFGLGPAAPAIDAPFAAAQQPPGQMRGVWISTVANIDWPSRSGLSAAEQQQEYRAILDNAVRLRLNAVVVQVRPTADALWPSPFEPWSQWLTGVQGRDPGYDPLAFLVQEAHLRGLEFHAWFNPFRVSRQADPARLVPEHPARTHPDWVFGYGGQLYYNPGIPEVRQFVTEAVMDAVTRYDVDAVHFDDYFYPYPVGGEQIPDGATFAQYGGAFTDVGDWRRDNVNQLVRGMSERIDAVKPEVEFGISPFGIWRNASTEPRGSATDGLESFSAIYADSVTWVEQGWVDYIAPQIYWEIGHRAADYAVLVPWWAGVVAGTGVELYVGQAAYKVGSTPAWDVAELSEHLTLNRAHPEVSGDVYFSARSLTSNAAAAIEQVAAEHYAQPAPSPDAEACPS